MNRIIVLRGIIHGKTIELESESGFEDGRQVEITLRAKALPGPPPGWKPESAASAAGMLASSWTDEDDRILEEIHRERKIENRKEVPE